MKMKALTTILSGLLFFIKHCLKQEAKVIPKLKKLEDFWGFS